MTTGNGKGIDPKLVVIVAGIVVAIILALAISSMGQSTELPSQMKVEVPNPIEKIIAPEDPTEVRLQKIATEEVFYLQSLMRNTKIASRFSIDDFCSEIILIEEAKDPLRRDYIELGTAQGYYIGPILFLDDKGNEVRVITATALYPEGGLMLWDLEYKNYQMIGTKKLNPTFKEKCGHLFKKR